MRQHLALSAIMSVSCVSGLTVAQPAATSRPQFPFGSRPADPEDAKRLDDAREWNRETGLSGSDITTFTEAEMATYCDLLARTHLSKFKREYDLTPDEAATVKKQLDAMTEESKEYWKKSQARLRSLMQQQRELSRNRDRDPEIEEQRRVIAREQTRIMQNNPLHFRIVRPAIEETLPPEKVEARRSRQEAMEEAMRESMRDPEVFRERFAMSRPAFRVYRAQRLRQLRAIRRFSGWDYYVRQFIEIYELTSDQQESAQSILREMTERRDRYEQTNGAKRQAARNLEAAERRRQLAEYSEPILQMFDEFKTRLDEIPTTAQRDAVAGDDDPRLAASRPAD